MRAKEKESFNQTYAYQNEMIQRIPILIDDLKSRTSDCDFMFDLNLPIRDYKDTLFESNWVHLNARGNEIVAKEILKTLSL